MFIADTRNGVVYTCIRGSPNRESLGNHLKCLENVCVGGGGGGGGGET